VLHLEWVRLIRRSVRIPKQCATSLQLQLTKQLHNLDNGLFQASYKNSHIFIPIYAFIYVGCQTNFGKLVMIILPNNNPECHFYIVHTSDLLLLTVRCLLLDILFFAYFLGKYCITKILQVTPS